MDLYNEIFRRKSTRKFSFRPLDERTVEKIKGRMISLPQLEMSCGIEMHFITAPEISGRFNLAGRVQAPHYVLISGSEEEACLMSAGFSTEYLVLYLTALGIATSYTGTSPDRHGRARVLGPETPDDFIAILALGSAKDAWEVYRRPEDMDREPLDKLIIEGRPTEDQRSILEAVQAAPSYKNSQPWRFAIHADGIRLMRARPAALKKLLPGGLPYFDFGAALAHLEIAADHFGYQCEIYYDEDLAEDPEYIQSVTLIKNEEEQ